MFPDGSQEAVRAVGDSLDIQGSDDEADRVNVYQGVRYKDGPQAATYPVWLHTSWTVQRGILPGPPV